MSELAGYYGGVTAIVCYLLPWVVSVILAILLYRLIQVKCKACVGGNTGSRLIDGYAGFLLMPMNNK